MNAIIPRATIEDIVRHRNRAITLYSEAYDIATSAEAKIQDARAAWKAAAPVGTAYVGQHEEVAAFHALVNIPDLGRFVRTATRLIDSSVWSSVIERTDLERLMDKQAKDELRNQMRYVPERTDRNSGAVINQQEIDKGLPPVTVENVQATLEHFMLNAELTWRRGIANAFAKLDRRFRSHDGWKIGSRIILTRCFNEYGSWSSYSNERETLMEIERIFTILDLGMVKASYASAIGAIDNARRSVHRAAQAEVDTEYFKIRIFMNGNAHLWMKRDDLVREVNKLLGEYYGDAIGDHDNVPTDEDVLNNPKTSLAKNMGFFPTPTDAAERVIAEARIHFDHQSERPLKILEPSAGTGNIARLAAAELLYEDRGSWNKEKGCYEERPTQRQKPIVDCVEFHEGRALGLEMEGLYRKVYHTDFIGLTPAVTGKYNRIVMNPPFDRDRDIDHVVHALKFLEDDGILVSIMSAGTEFRETKKAVAFRELIAQRKGYFVDLPAGSFAGSGTYINTIICIVGRLRW